MPRRVRVRRNDLREAETRTGSLNRDGGCRPGTPKTVPGCCPGSSRARVNDQPFCPDAGGLEHGQAVSEEAVDARPDRSRVGGQPGGGAVALDRMHDDEPAAGGCQLLVQAEIGKAPDVVRVRRAAGTGEALVSGTNESTETGTLPTVSCSITGASRR
jgi:hypothetical protein